jgi:nucleoside-diphosphate-sugar epimerase
MNILSAAAESRTVKRVVITSSITPLIDMSAYAKGSLKQELHRSRNATLISSKFSLTSPGDDEIFHYDTKAQFPHPLLAYGASKSMALDAAENYMKTKKPAFDVVYLMPSLIIGANHLAKTREEFISGTNAPLMKQLLGEKFPAPRLGSSVSIDDVAKLHVLALNPVSSGRYLVASDGSIWEDANSIVKEYFPEEIGKSLSAEGEVATVAISVDTEKTQEAFGIKFQRFEEHVKDAVKSYLALP